MGNIPVPKIPKFRGPPKGKGLAKGRGSPAAQRRTKQLKQSEAQSQQVAKRMEQEVDQEMRDENAVDRQEQQKEKITKADKKLVNAAIRNLMFCKVALKTGRLTAALKNLSNAYGSVNMLIRSDSMKQRLSQAQGQEIGRDMKTTQMAEAQTLWQARQTQGRQGLRKRRL